MRKRNQKKGGRAKMWLAMLACLTVLGCGSFFAARQHFSSIDFGMKNSRLRKQIDDLESEKRRLLLAREVSLSPAELKKAALKAKVAIADDVSAKIASVIGNDKTTPQATTAALKPTTANPLITKTVATSATIAKPITTSLEKPAPKALTVDRKLMAQRSATE